MNVLELQDALGRVAALKRWENVSAAKGCSRPRPGFFAWLEVAKRSHAQSMRQLSVAPVEPPAPSVQQQQDQRQDEQQAGEEPGAEVASSEDSPSPPAPDKPPPLQLPMAAPPQQAQLSSRTERSSSASSGTPSAASMRLHRAWLEQLAGYEIHFATPTASYPAR